jgi:flagellar protein FlbD
VAFARHELLKSADINSGGLLVRLTRLNHASVVLNSELIEHIDITPDTVITLTNGQILRVLETAEEVIQRVVEYRRCIVDPPKISGLLTAERVHGSESQE